MYQNTKQKMMVNNSSTFAFCNSVKNLFPSDGNNFEKIAEFHLNKILSEENSQKSINFTELLRQMQGIFPADLFKLIVEKKVNIDYSVPLDESSNIGWHQLALDSNLPAPHLANYEWRFTEDSAKAIVEIIKENSYKDIKICCLGTPSIALELIRNGMGENTTFLDINEPLKKLIERKYDESGITCKTYDAQNIPQRKFLNSFDFVVVNPPWYLDYYNLFISRAIDFLKPDGGKILTPLFPAFSRQNALKDLKAFELSLEESNCKEVNPKLLVEFEMPEFEEAILKQNNIPLPESNWRNGELVELVFDTNKKSSITGNLKIEKRKWLRYVEDKLSIAVANPLKIADNSSNNDSYFAETHILTTVSRKEIENMEIDVWDSNNKVTVFIKAK